MAGLTDPDELAGLVSEVTDILCGVTFAPWDPLARGESLYGRMVMMTLDGERPVDIALSSDPRGSRALARAMFRCAPEEITPARIDDAIRELLNVVAGKVARALNIDQPLSLPRPITLAELSERGGPAINDGVLMRSNGEIDIRLWIFERSPAGTSAEPGARGGRLRSLVRRLGPRS